MERGKVNLFGKVFGNHKKEWCVRFQKVCYDKTYEIMHVNEFMIIMESFGLYSANILMKIVFT